jgi:hypothetical protein
MSDEESRVVVSKYSEAEDGDELIREMELTCTPDSYVYDPATKGCLFLDRGLEKRVLEEKLSLRKDYVRVSTHYVVSPDGLTLNARVVDRLAFWKE